MTFDDFIGGFDEDEYAASIKNFNRDQLRNEHSAVRQKVLSAKSTMGAMGVAAFHSFGISLVGAGVGWRKHNYNKKKQNICEAHMRRKGWHIEDMSTRDLVMAIGPAAVASAIAPGAEHIANHLISHVAGHGAAAYTSHHVTESLLQATHHPEQFAHALSDGACSQVSAVGQGLVGHTAHLVPIDAVAQNTPQFLGNVAGQGIANTAELAVVKKGVKIATKKGFSLWFPRAEDKEVTANNKQTGDVHYSVNSSNAGSNLLSESTTDDATHHIQGVKRGSRSDARTSEPSHSTPQEIAPLLPFVYFLLPAIIHDLIGLHVLQAMTLIFILWDPITSRQTKLLSRWRYLLPAVLASIFDGDTLWTATFMGELWMAFYSYKAYITSPGIFASIAIPIVCCTSLTESPPEYFGRGFCLSATFIALIQFGFTRESFDKKSAKYVRWYSLRRSDYITFLMTFLFMAGQSRLDSYGWAFWFGLSSAGCSITVVQYTARWF